MSFCNSTLLLIGHGSTVNGDSGATVRQHAEEVRRRAIFAGVQVGFFKITPRIGPALAGIRTPRVFVVPLFVSEGYFTRQAIPCELGLPAGSQDVMPCTVHLDGREVVYCDPVGTHPLMTEIILKRVGEVLAKPGAPLAPYSSTQQATSGDSAESTLSGSSSLNHSSLSHSSTALVIAGHGTPLNADSRKSIERQVELIGSRRMFAEVRPAFLEEEPRIADIADAVAALNVVVVPFFMSDGLHVCEDIPVLLGERKETVQARLRRGEWPWQNPTTRAGKNIYYARSVGSEPGIADVILERVRAAAN